MARKSIDGLGELQKSVMEAIWEAGGSDGRAGGAT